MALAESTRLGRGFSDSQYRVTEALETEHKPCLQGKTIFSPIYQGGMFGLMRVKPESKTTCTGMAGS